MSRLPADDPINDMNPYLHGLYAPVAREVSGAALAVEGEIPADLHGAYFRNGPNPARPPQGMHHWFDGDGMVHGLWFENGEARYANRFVRSADFIADQRGEPGADGIFRRGSFDDGRHSPYKDTANTDVIFHNGKLLALWYISGAPVMMNVRNLDTLGAAGFGDQRLGNVSAHSKTDPRTGELVFFDYGLYRPVLSYGTVSSHGQLTHFTEVPVPGPRLPHDMGLTENYVILHDLPLVFSRQAMEERRWQVHFRDMPTRFGVAPRHGDGSETRWFEFDPCYIYHVINAWEEGDEVIMAACRMVPNRHRPDAERFGPYAAMVNVLALHAHPYLWRMNLRTGAVSETQLDDRISEFPVINLDRSGVASQYSYHVMMADDPLQLFEGLYKYDLGSGNAEQYRFDSGVYGSEPVFAPRVGATGEDDGYVVTFVTDEADGHSEALVLDASNFAAGPVARILLPQRVPLGFHGTWVRGDQMSA